MPAQQSSHAAEVVAGRRFEFGKNWQRYLKLLTPQRIALAEQSLCSSLQVADLAGVSMLDIGSGSGLFSLAARRLGAKVHSFDFDPQSVAGTQELKQRYFPNDPDWTIEEGSALDADYLRSLGQFDLVYSWGVLHHTGAMWQALENATLPVAPGGRLFIAIYNKAAYWSRTYRWLKRCYVKSPRPGKWLIAGCFIVYLVLRGLFDDLLLQRNPLARYRTANNPRGMSLWCDAIDWIGGYPYETATTTQIFEFFHARGYVLEKLKGAAGIGCSEFVFRKAVDSWTWTNERYTLAIDRRTLAA